MTCTLIAITTIYIFALLKSLLVTRITRIDLLDLDLCASFGVRFIANGIDETSLLGSYWPTATVWAFPFVFAFGRKFSRSKDLHINREQNTFLAAIDQCTVCLHCLLLPTVT